MTYSRGLDFEAARVAYVVDTDDGGAALRTALTRAGVPERLIADLGAPGIESLIAPHAYRDALQALLPECNVNVSANIPPDVPVIDSAIGEPPAAFVRTWVEAQGLKMPSKVAVASWLVQTGRASVRTEQEALLRDLHENLLKALDYRDS